MAEKRMYSKKVTETDDFLALPLSTQALYFHLGMNADDDGFVSAPQKVARMLGSNKNDMDLLLFKKYLIPFENGVCVIKHWRINNYLRGDRYNETVYTEEKAQLTITPGGSYELVSNSLPGIPVVYVDKDSKEKISIDAPFYTFQGKVFTKLELIKECFNKFYSLYPNKRDRGAAEKKYEIVLRDSKTAHDLLGKASRILEGLNGYLAHIKINNTEAKFIKHPKTWIFNKCWEDEYDKPATAAKEPTLREIMGFGTEGEK